MPITVRPLAKRPGHCLKDYRYYRCTGSDGYRFGGERICSNGQIRAELLEVAVWREVCDLLRNPEKLEREFKEGGAAVASSQNAEALKARRLKQQHALERLNDSFTDSRRALGSLTTQDCPGTRVVVPVHVAFRTSVRRQHPDCVFSELNTQPTYPLFTLRLTPHGARRKTRGRAVR